MSNKVTIIITNEPDNVVTIKWDGARFTIVRESHFLPNGYVATIYNPREAQDLASFINKFNTAYQKERREKKALQLLDKYR